MNTPRFRAVPALRLGGLGLRPFLRNRLTAAALAALAVIPLLYSGLYLWSFWDPFDRMDELPVALVNEDRPASDGEGEVDAGAELAEELVDGGELDWHPVGAEEAAAGVADGRYYVSLTVPADFSARLAEAGDDGGEAVPAMLEARYDDAHGYIVRQLMSSAFAEVESAAGSSAASGYLDAMFVGFNDVHAATEEAAGGAAELSEGSTAAEDGAAELATGVGDLHDGSAELADGAATASDGVAGAVDRLDPVAEEWIPALRESAPEIESGARAASDAAESLSDALDDLPEDSAQAAEDASGLSTRIQERLDADPGMAEADPELYALLTDAQGAADQAAELNGFVADNRDRVDAVAADADEVAGVAAGLAEDAPDLADGAEDAMERIGDLDDGLSDLADGAADLRDGLGTASGGADDLESGLGELSDGSAELAGGLDEGADAVPTYGGDDARDERSDTMGDPVRLTSATDHPAPDYGTGFAPFFIALSLWVGAMMVFMVLPPVSARGLASTAPSWRIALAGWVPAAVIGTAQVAVSLTALHFLLGLDAVNWPGAAGLLLLTAGAYAAIVQWANTRFGAAGRVVALMMLMLQLTSAGGTYPIETSPGFFQAVSPYLPMTWVVSALRVLISGGDMGTVTTACAVLGGYLAVFLVLTWWAVARKRVWTMSDLHPALKL